MSIEIVRGTSSKPVASDKLVNIFADQTHWSGQLFIGYPVIGTQEGPHRIDALWVSQQKGVVIFDLIEGHDLGDYQFRQFDSANMIDARLRTQSDLVERGKSRKLRVPIHTISFAPTINQLVSENPDYLLTSPDSILDELAHFEWPKCNHDLYRTTLSVIENISTIRRKRGKRTVSQEKSRGARLKNLETSIATLDHTQNRAVIETVEGLQRIRGLAGSGKTIVLALKAAYLHAQYPEWRIAVTFNTRSLKGFYRQLIRDFHIQQTNEEPDWENLRVINSWGAPGGAERSGIYYEFCRLHAIEYLNFGSAKSRFGQDGAFAGACGQALKQAKAHNQAYDVLLVDEAQDLPPQFLRLCHAFLKEPKRLVYAYDELQNLSGESLPSPKRIFGAPFGDGANSHAKRDLVLPTCYRNSRPVLVTAHALGFGIYRSPPPKEETGLVQMFDHPGLWKDVGYRVQDGELKENVAATLYRTVEASPKFLEEHSLIDDLVRFESFDDEREQAKWLVEEIGKNIEEDELLPSDIMVINPDPLTTREKVGTARALLLDKGIRSHLAGVDTAPDAFNMPAAESVTFTGIHRAKGNEAAMVYVINTDDCQSSASSLAHIRNQLFTAITRSKAWVRVLGVGSRMTELIGEYERLKANEFKLHFKYPSLEERKRLRVVHRDMTQNERQRLRGSNHSLNEFIRSIQLGEVRLEDIDSKTLDKLQALLQKRS